MTDDKPQISPGVAATVDADETARLEKVRDDEFDKYYKHHDVICKAEDDAEKNFDTTLMALASLAIGSTFTLLKDITSTPGAVLIFLSWIALAGCLFAALIDRLLSYTTHKKWRLEFDREYGDWKEGAWQRSLATRDTIRFMKWLPRLKWIGFWTLIAGLLLLLLGGVIGWHGTSAPTVAPTTPVVVNVYAATTQPTTRP